MYFFPLGHDAVSFFFFFLYFSFSSNVISIGAFECCSFPNSLVFFASTLVNNFLSCFSIISIIIIFSLYIYGPRVYVYHALMTILLFYCSSLLTIILGILAFFNTVLFELFPFSHSFFLIK